MTGADVRQELKMMLQDDESPHRYEGQCGGPEGEVQRGGEWGKTACEYILDTRVRLARWSEHTPCFGAL